MKPKFGAVLFDLDDTLFDRRQSAVLALHDWATHNFDKKMNLTQVVQEWKKAWEAAGPDQLRCIAAFAGQDLDDETAAVLLRDYRHRYLHNSVWFHDAGPGVAAARGGGRSVGIFTAGARSSQERKVAQLLAAADLPLFAKEMSRSPKADQESIAEICFRFAVEPSEILHIDDNPDELAASAVLGMKTALIRRNTALAPPANYKGIVVATLTSPELFEW